MYIYIVIDIVYIVNPKYIYYINVTVEICIQKCQTDNPVADSGNSWTQYFYVHS